MKKLSLVLLGALAVAQAAQAAPCSFTGFYVGGQLGWTQRSDKTSIPAIQETLLGVVVSNSALNKTTKKNGLTYGLYTGYGQNNNGFYWGGEFSIESDTASKNVSNSITPTYTSGGVTLNGTGTITTKYDRGIVFGITPRIGGVFDRDNLVYVKLGMEISRDKAKASLNAQATGGGSTYSFSSSGSKSKTQLAFVPGIGYERAFSPHLLGRVEYGYNCGGKINYGGTTIKYTAQVVKVGLHYKF